MEPFLEHADMTIWNGEARAVLAEMPDESVDCIVTSPPYWGLRDYGTGTWTGGDPDCDHEENAPKIRPKSSLNKGFNERVGRAAGRRKQEELSNTGIASWTCICGAEKEDEQLGLEPNVEDYVQRIVGIFAEARRVLSKTGTFWLNMGDTFAAKRSYQVPDTKYERMRQNRGAMSVPAGLHAKDMIGVPWRVAFALQDDGWRLRMDNIWNKTNAMPEQVKDRPTKGHEYVFLFSRAAKYFFDYEAVKEPAAWERWGTQTSPKYEATDTASGWMETRTKEDLQAQANGKKNMRSVWSFPTEPYGEAHFAPFPRELPRRCIRAGSPKGGIVLDPFAGSGTTGLVAREEERHAVLIELNTDYCRQIAKRLQQLPLHLA